MATTTWTGKVSNKWNDSGNWTNGVPTYDITPVIQAASNVAIDLSGNESSNSLEIDGTGNVALSNGTLALNGTATIASGATLVLNGATLTADKTSGGTLTLANGASVKVGTPQTTTINFGTNTASARNTFTVNNNGTVIANVTNLSPGDDIVFPNANWNHSIQWVQNSDGTYSIYDQYSTTSSNDILVKNVTLAKGVKTSDFAWDDNRHAIVCFLPGSLIATPDGEIAVEHIQIGDLITTMVDGRAHSRAVRWVGKIAARVRAGVPDDEAGYPVRILRDALAQGVPSQDLVVTPEHCLFLDGGFIPVRMLVNGRSIVYDRAQNTYDTYHVETDDHAIIIANGVMTESYLDTGNRAAFRQHGTLARIGGSPVIRSWAEDAAAPLVVSREAVEPVYRAIAERASALGIAAEGHVTEQALVDEPAVHLLTDAGIVLQPVAEEQGTVSFLVPGDVGEAWLISRASRPCDVVGPFVDDRRSLGVLVGEMMLRGPDGRQAMHAHLEDAELAGWHGIEASSHRWTKGKAQLILPERPRDVDTMLTVEIVSAGPYRLAQGRGQAA